ncbi:hypothetical protein L596_002709 [Steinernema carpocapsae]|uniref:Uncharacterized protein n=1 Tax=Steinernema carpocapsae TaxID=34508 RepID=A0A4U8UQI3_STECR|nr:hypothetical protein L596_002709 [Steinernema carpocapsae]
MTFLFDETSALSRPSHVHLCPLDRPAELLEGRKRRDNELLTRFGRSLARSRRCTVISRRSPPRGSSSKVIRKAAHPLLLPRRRTPSFSFFSSRFFAPCSSPFVLVSCSFSIYSHILRAVGWIHSNAFTGPRSLQQIRLRCLAYKDSWLTEGPPRRLSPRNAF